jgi:hypothetical protein
MTQPDQTANEMLKDKFAAKYADAAVGHFKRMIQDYQQREWDDANAKAGKFVEAVLKALWGEAGETVPKGKAFKAGTIMEVLPDFDWSAHSVQLCRVAVAGMRAAPSGACQ